MHKITHVYAIGDSFAFGQGLKGCVKNSNGFYVFNDELRKTVYSSIISDSIGAINYINKAKPGSSNDRTIRKIFHDIKSMIDDGINPESIFVIISITHSARVEIFDSRHKKYYQLINNCPPTRINMELLRYWQTYISYFDHIIENSDRYLNQIISMQLFLEKYNIKYIMTDSMNENNEFNNFVENYRSALYHTINRVRYPKIMSFQEYTHKNGFKSTPCLHPDEEGHKAWAEYLLTYIKENKLLENL